VQQRHGGDIRLLDGGDHLKAPLVGQPVVHDRHLEVLPLGHLPRLRPRTGRDHTPPLPGERTSEVQPLLVVPYDQQNGPVQNATPTSIRKRSPSPQEKYIHKNASEGHRP
jgi:hypothetical protein